MAFIAQILILSLNHALAIDSASFSNVNYSSLEESFQNGHRPSAKELTQNYWSGRCYQNTSPEKASNGAVQFTQTQYAPELGDESPLILQGAPIRFPDETPEYFDEMNVEGFSELNPLFFDMRSGQKSLSIEIGYDLVVYYRINDNKLIQEEVLVSDDEKVVSRCIYTKH